MEDTGLGIARGDQKIIFESFGQIYHEDTKKLGGTGLGLTIVLRLLKLMHCDLQLQSEEGIGSQIRFDVEFDFLTEITEQSTKTETSKRAEKS